MEHHPRILEQRVEIPAVGRRGDQALERVRGVQQEQHEADDAKAAAETTAAADTKAAPKAKRAAKAKA